MKMNLKEALNATQLKKIGKKLAPLARRDRTTKAIVDKLNAGKEPTRQEVLRLKQDPQDEVVMAFAEVIGPTQTTKILGIDMDEETINESRGNKKIKGKDQAINATNPAQYVNHISGALIANLNGALKQVGLEVTSKKTDRLNDLVRKRRPDFKGENDVVQNKVKRALFSKSTLTWSGSGKSIKFTYTVPVEVEGKKEDREYGGTTDMNGILYHNVLGKIYDGQLEINGFDTSFKNLSESKEVVKEILRSMAEGVKIDDSRYKRAHGKSHKAPSGSARWMFTTKKMGDPSDDEMLTVRGTAPEAKKAAKEWGKKKGVSTVYVMEDVNLEEGFKKGDYVKPKIGAHKGVRHKVIHVFDDGRINIQPVGIPIRNVRYRQGMVTAKPDQVIKEGVNLEEDFKKGDQVKVKDHVKKWGGKTGVVNTALGKELMVRLDGRSSEVSFFPGELVKEETINENIHVSFIGTAAKNKWMREQGLNKNDKDIIKHDKASLVLPNHWKTYADKKKWPHLIYQVKAVNESFMNESFDGKDYTATSEKNKDGGYRPKVVHNKKNTVLFLSGHAYKTAKDAVDHAQAYLDAYDKSGHRAAERADRDFKNRNKSKLFNNA